ncbi:MAG: hypothetical protein IKK93_00775 [Campylobacter sp.]|nr:hypothetical protein [Campylobacter sp.]
MKKLFFVVIIAITSLLFISCEDLIYQESFVSEGIVDSKYHKDGTVELKYSYGLKPDGKMGYRWMPTSVPAENDVYFRYTREDGEVIKTGYDSAYYYGKYQIGDTVKIYYTKCIYENKKGVQRIKYSLDKIE